MCGAPSISTTILRLKSLAGTTAADPPLTSLRPSHESAKCSSILPRTAAQVKIRTASRADRCTSRSKSVISDTLRLTHAYACVTVLRRANAMRRLVKAGGTGRPWSAIAWGGGGSPNKNAGCGPCIPPCPRSGRARLCGSRCPRPTGRGSSRWRGRSPRRPPPRRGPMAWRSPTLMHTANLPQPEPGPLDWMDWERRKTLRLLLSGR